MECLFQGLGGVLRLTAITREALLCCEALSMTMAFQATKLTRPCRRSGIDFERPSTR